MNRFIEETSSNMSDEDGYSGSVSSIDEKEDDQN